MNVPASLAVALMAGGRSVRMQQDKSRLRDVSGRELWQDRLALLEQVAGGEVMISCRPDQDFFPARGVRLVRDTLPDAGPLGGIVSCLEAVQCAQLLVLAVDLPGVTREILTFLLEAAGDPESGGPARGAVFRREGFLEPLVAVYPQTMALSGRRRLVEGDLALRGWIEEAGDAMQVLELPAAWDAALVNVNHPDEWQDWLGRRP